MLIDFTNPSLKDGNYYRPACYPVKSDNLENFTKGKGQIEVQHKDYYTKEGELEEDVTSLVYASDEIDSKYFEGKKVIQELGEETISEQEDTANKDAVKQTMEEQERVAIDAKDNAQSL